MNRYKVVQDGNGEWGILDLRAEEARLPGFASWAYEDLDENRTSGAEMLDEIVYWAGELNTGEQPRLAFGWTPYTPRKGD